MATRNDNGAQRRDDITVSLIILVRNRQRLDLTSATPHKKKMTSLLQTKKKCLHFNKSKHLWTRIQNDCLWFDLRSGNFFGCYSIFLFAIGKYFYFKHIPIHVTHTRTVSDFQKRSFSFHLSLKIKPLDWELFWGNWLRHNIRTGHVQCLKFILMNLEKFMWHTWELNWVTLLSL